MVRVNKVLLFVLIGFLFLGASLIVRPAMAYEYESRLSYLEGDEGIVQHEWNDRTGGDFFSEERDVFPREEIANPLARSLNGWVQRNGFWYFYTNNVRQSGWLLRGSNWYFLHTTTGRMQTEWLQRGSNWYFLNPPRGITGHNANRPEGAMLTGWLLRGSSNWYFLNPPAGEAGHNASRSEGIMLTGWLYRHSQWYFLNPPAGGAGHNASRSEGIMLTGWLSRNGDYFFLNPFLGQANHHNGSMFRNGSFVISGVVRRFDSSGRWLPNNNIGTIAYAGGGHTSGTVPASHTLTVPGSAQLRQPGTMARAGYTFAGWRSSASGNIFQAGATVTFNNPGTTTYTAVWNRNSANIRTIAYAGGGHTGGTVPASHTVNVPGSLQLRGPGTMVRAGYTFAGWRSSVNGTIRQAGEIVNFTATGTTTYTAVWNRNNNAQPITSVSIDHVSVTDPRSSRTISIGQNFAPTARTIPVGRAGELTWTSSNPLVAMVHSTTGWITAISVGTTTIRATDPSSGRNATITIRVVDGTWNDYENDVTFWNLRTLNIYVHQTPNAPAGFNFTTHMNDARSQWSSAVGGMNFVNSPHSNAHILAYGGSRAEIYRIARRYGIESEGWAGVARATWETPVGTININGVRNVYRFNVDARTFQNTSRAVMLVASNPPGLIMSRSSAEVRKLSLHELGHLMGYVGHSLSENDVMFNTTTTSQQLSQAERTHLRRIYDRFRTAR